MAGRGKFGRQPKEEASRFTATLMVQTIAGGPPGLAVHHPKAEARAFNRQERVTEVSRKLRAGITTRNRRVATSTTYPPECKVYREREEKHNRIVYPGTKGCTGATLSQEGGWSEKRQMLLSREDKDRMEAIQISKERYECLVLANIFQTSHREIIPSCLLLLHPLIIQITSPHIFLAHQALRTRHSVILSDLTLSLIPQKGTTQVLQGREQDPTRIHRESSTHKHLDQRCIRQKANNSTGVTACSPFIPPS